MLREDAIRFAHENRSLFQKKLSELISIPSISTDPKHIPDAEYAARWVASELTQLGFSDVTVFPTQKHPIVYGEWLQAGKNAPTVLIYGHYDVQPADPVDLWKSPPFKATIIGENIYGRGASDMKGQVVATICAVQSLFASGPSPVNIKYLIEGEEEIGSPSLDDFIEKHKQLLSCTFALNPDSGMISSETPTIIYALRGLAYFELRIFGPARDLHSGMYGGVVHNPAIVLSDLISGMHDSCGRITLPGFYDRVLEISDEERERLSQLDLDDDYYLDVTGTPALWGEAGFSPAERVGARPTLDVNGMISGFTGVGSKTVIPAWAMAKISMRLVPHQDPSEVHQQLVNYLEQHAPKTVRWELTAFGGSPACVTDIRQLGTQAISKALATVWGKPPVFKREGGSIPVVASMQRILGVDSIVAGFGLPDDNLHAPNEKLHLPTWYRGIDALIHFFYNLDHQ